MTALTRRGFLKVLGVSSVAVASGCSLGQGSPAPGNGQATPDAFLPTAGPGTPTVWGLARPPQDIAVYSQSQLYRQSYSSVPEVNLENWTLTIDGLVENPRTLTFAEVATMPKVEEMRTLECIGNPVGGSLIGNVRWGGFYLRDVLAAVGIKSSARRAKFRAADGYETAVGLKWITQPDTLVAYEINGEPLAPEHGFPLRILMPGLYGQKMPKWIERIEFIDDDFLGYWERQGWSDVAEVRTNSQVKQPRGLQEVPAGEVPLFGLAFAGKRRIVKVEVQIDTGAWQEAQRLQTDSPLIWTQWTFDWPAEAGRHTVAVRATDEAGFVQTGRGAGLLGDAFPDGSDDIHSIVVRVA